jgi:23S rRNA (uridine2552-2'-O)-methyltransferase
MKRSRWEDHFARRARKENWLARSVYKLEEIDKRFGIISHGARILDLGCYPGSWSQYSVRRVGPKGDVVGIDLKEPDHFSARNFRYIEADVLKLDSEWLYEEIGYRDVVLSDLAPQTSGIKMVDTARSLELVEKTVAISSRLLKKDGLLLCKIFEGDGLKALRADISKKFRKVQLIRPAAVRRGSREIYLFGQNLLRAWDQN